VKERTGYIFLHRKLIDSRVFQNAYLLKVFIWCLLKANHEGRWVPITTGKGKTEVFIQPGQFIFGRATAASELQMPDSSVRNRIRALQKKEVISVKADSHYSTITIVNWDTYQANGNKMDRQGTGKGQPEDTNKNDKNDKKKAPDLFSLKKRYPHQDLIESAIRAFSLTRKRGKISDNILITQLQKWEKFPVEQVEASIRKYLEKNYAAQGKGEAYLLAIIRNSCNRQTGIAKSKSRTPEWL
jgi:hypothetical protein